MSLPSLNAGEICRSCSTGTLLYRIQYSYHYILISSSYYVLSFSFAYCFHTAVMERAVIEEL